jgi:hypothetical protein
VEISGDELADTAANPVLLPERPAANLIEHGATAPRLRSP